jgi:hypothetical protein
MVDTTWNATAGTDYFDPGDWNNGVPFAGDTAVFSSLGTVRTVTIAAPGGDTGGWIFNRGAYTVDISGTFTLDGAGIQVSGTGKAHIFVKSGGIFDVSSAGRATIEAEGDAHVAGVLASAVTALPWRGSSPTMGRSPVASSS